MKNMICSACVMIMMSLTLSDGYCSNATQQAPVVYPPRSTSGFSRLTPDTRSEEQKAADRAASDRVYCHLLVNRDLLSFEPIKMVSSDVEVKKYWSHIASTKSDGSEVLSQGSEYLVLKLKRILEYARAADEHGDFNMCSEDDIATLRSLTLDTDRLFGRVKSINQALETLKKLRPMLLSLMPAPILSDTVRSYILNELGKEKPLDATSSNENKQRMADKLDKILQYVGAVRVFCNFPDTCSRENYRRLADLVVGTKNQYGSVPQKREVINDILGQLQELRPTLLAVMEYSQSIAGLRLNVPFCTE